MKPAAFLKMLGRRAGVEISRYRAHDARRLARLREFGVRLVIDAGANRGQYARALRKGGYGGLIVSFEPLSDAFAELESSLSADPRWTGHRLALGEGESEQVIHVASSDASSSLLLMTDELAAAIPGIGYTRTERIIVRALDDVALPVERPALLKMDVQGYEDRVLRGAARTLQRVALIEAELSLANLYEEQPSFSAMIAFLHELGFEIVDLDPFFYARPDGRVLSVDATFARYGVLDVGSCR
jgi:FkbM family methyltransferase